LNTYEPDIRSGIINFELSWCELFKAGEIASRAWLLDLPLEPIALVLTPKNAF